MQMFFFTKPYISNEKRHRDNSYRITELARKEYTPRKVTMLLSIGSSNSTDGNLYLFDK